MNRISTVPLRDRRAVRSWSASAVILGLLLLPAVATADGDKLSQVTQSQAKPDFVWRDLVGLQNVPTTIDGRGVGVALIDSGVTDVPDLHDRVVARVDFTEEQDGLDTYGHGTHMAGIIAGDGSSSDGKWQGAAPGANLISLKVASWNGATDTSSVIAALRWVVTNRERYNIRVVNLSFGTDGRQSYRDDPLDRAVERVWEAGIVVVVAAGNSGGAVAKPGDDPRVVTVGSFDHRSTQRSNDDRVAAFSPRGPTQDGIEKPDIVAPGVSIVATRAEGSTLDAARPEALRVGHYVKGTGTSQSAAIVTGVAARVLQANPTLTPDEVKSLLIDTTDKDLVGQAGAGHGAVNARAAVDAARGRRSWARPSATPEPSSGMGTLEGTRGSAHVYADLQGMGEPEVVAGEVDVLGLGFDAADVATTPWTRQTWLTSPWSAIAVETPGFTATPVSEPIWGGVSSDASSWDARGWTARGWTARGWTALDWSPAQQT